MTEGLEGGLTRRITALIARDGPLTIERFMTLCLHDPGDGYYATRPDLGETGDFITAPLVSQMFGELLGLWAATVWSNLGAPSRVRLAEAGPGLGVMMSDMLRAAGRAPGFLEACAPCLVETSPPLRERQARTLGELSLSTGAPPLWVERLENVPDDAPVILIANEFLDCLPIRQIARTREGWRERRIGLDPEGALTFTLGEAVTIAAPDAPIGAIVETSEPLAATGRLVGDLVIRSGGAALFIDYGRDRPGHGDTLQALRRHGKESPLAHPGEADLTAHVDFPAFLAAARSSGAAVTAIRTQGEFLRDLGLDLRAEALTRSRPDRRHTIARQAARLTAPDQMGALFKVAAVHAPGLALPGLETQP